MPIDPHIADAMLPVARRLLRIWVQLPNAQSIGFLVLHPDAAKTCLDLAHFKHCVKKALVRMAFRALTASGAAYVARELLQRNRVTVITYHDVSRAKADEHLDWLKSRYNIISLNTYLDAMKSGRLGDLPRKAMVITLDDGWRQNLELVPVLRRHDVPATIFICSDFARREAILPKDDKRFLTEEEIATMRPYVDFQAHTVSHARLPYASHEEAALEISRCKRYLESELGLTIRSLAYPNGDYSRRDMALAQAAGYECALTEDPGSNSKKANPYCLKRTCILDDADIDELIAKSSGAWWMVRRLLKKQAFGEVKNPG